MTMTKLKIHILITFCHFGKSKQWLNDWLQLAKAFPYVPDLNLCRVNTSTMHLLMALMSRSIYGI